MTNELTCIFEDAEIAELVKIAKKAEDEYEVKLNALSVRMREWLQTQMPIDAVIDTRPNIENPRPHYLRFVTIMSGNARRSKKFRVVSIGHIEPNLLYPELSTWNCTAVPISEKTGEDMRATAGNSRFATPSKTVSLRGCFGNPL